MDADVDKDSEDPRAVLDAELSMLPVWNFSLQDLWMGMDGGNGNTLLSNHVDLSPFIDIYSGFIAIL